MPGSLVSIIIPCFNAERYIAQAIQSAIDQTHSNCEVIVIDDGSTDRSLEIIKSFGNKIRWESGPNRGGCAARNRGLELATGEWIQFLDADDAIHPQKLTMQLPLVQGRRDAAIGCNLVRFRGDLQTKQVDSRRVPLMFEMDGVEYCIRKRLGEISGIINPEKDATIGHSYPHCWLLPRELVDATGKWDENLKCAQDTEYFNRMYLKAKRILHLGMPLAYYRTDVEQSVSKGSSRGHIESLMLYAESARQILDIDDSVRARIGVARIYHRIIRKSHSHFKDISRVAEAQIKGLSIPKGSEASSPLFSLFSKYLGPLLSVRILSLSEFRRMTKS